MERRRTTINARKYDGAIHRSWQADLVGRDGSLLVFKGVFERAVEHPDLGVIAAGTVSVEYYWTDRWYNVFRFHDPDGAFRNYYCNVNLPPVPGDGVLDYVDLDIDILVGPDLTARVLDREEFEANATRFGYPDATVGRALQTVGELLAIIGSGGFPFDANGRANLLQMPGGFN